MAGADRLLDDDHRFIQRFIQRFPTHHRLLMSGGMDE